MNNLYILLPVFNAEETIQRAIDSVLDQLGANIKLLIINDGSNDNSKSIINSFLLKSSYIEYIEQENKGLSSALDFAIKYLQKKKLKNIYVSRLDSDDEYTKSGAIDILNFINNLNKNYYMYIFGLLNSDGSNLSNIKVYDRYLTNEECNNLNIADFIDTVCPVINLEVYDNPKYSYDKVPNRSGDGIPSMRIQKDFGFYITNIYFYKVHKRANSLSRRLITKEYAKIALETNKIILDEFCEDYKDIKTINYGNFALIISRYYAVLGEYKDGFKYLIKGIKYNPKNILYIGVAIVCFIPGGYKIVNYFVNKFLFK